MSKTFFEVAMSLDGFIAGPNGGPKNPLGDGGMNLHQWMYPLKSWRQLVGLEGGVTNGDDKIVKLEIAEVIHSPKVTHLKYSIMQ